jgi:hypothetical protein
MYRPLGANPYDPIPSSSQMMSLLRRSPNGSKQLETKTLQHGIKKQFKTLSYLLISLGDCEKFPVYK